MTDTSLDPWAQLEDADEPATEDDAVTGGPPSVPQPEHASCPDQWAYIVDDSSMVTACMSRRAGKTTAAVIKGARKLCKPGARAHYFSLIRRNAKSQYLYELIGYLERSQPPKGTPFDWRRHGLGWVRDQDFKVNEVDMILATSWGSTLKAASCPDLAAVSSARGDRSDWVCVDEMQTPANDVVQALIDDVAGPMTTDTGGTIDQLGSPPEVEPCYFSEALDNPNYSHHKWSQFDFDQPRPREAKWATAKERIEARGLRFAVEESQDGAGRLLLRVDPAGTHPIVLREYFGIRARDPAKTAYEYQKGWNDYDPDTINWDKVHRTFWGLDLGFQDSDALTVAQQVEEGGPLLVRWYWQANHLDTFLLADLLRVVKTVFPPDRTTGDHGGHGAVKTMKSIERALDITIRQKPGDVMVSVGFVNDDFRGRRLLLPVSRVQATELLIQAACRIYAAEPERLDAVLKLLRADVPDLGTECQLVQKTVNTKTRKVEINKKGHHSDLTEALRYMRASLVFRPEDPEEPTVTDPDELNLQRVNAFEDQWRRQASGGWR